MSDDINRQIAELEESLKLPLPATVRQQLEATLRQLRASALSTTGLVGQADNSGTVRGAVVGVNTGTIQLFFGARPPADAKKLLDSYLDALLERYQHLSLGRLIDKDRTGAEQSAAPALSLRAVYTALATDARLPRERFDLDAAELDTSL